MEQYFLVAVKAIVPLFLLILTGTYIRWRKLLDDHEIRRVNSMVFEVFFFCMMFHNLYVTSLDQALRPKLIVFSVAAVFAVIAGATFFVLRITQDNKTRGAMIQALYRSNFVLLGIPMVENIFGRDALAVPTMMIAIVVPIFNIMGVFILETFRGEGRFSLRKTLGNVLRNPMIVGAVCGFFFLFTGIRIPDFLEKPIAQLSACTSPVALLILGASFKVGTLGNDVRDLVLTVAGRLLVVPALVLGTAMFLGFRGIEFVTLLSIFATPCAVASFAMAQQLGSNAELAGNAVVISSGLSCVTLFFWVVLFQYLGVF